jgi:coenzyme F420-reducing hydrogenase delta subunit
MTVPTPNGPRHLLFHCIRQRPEKHADLLSSILGAVCFQQSGRMTADEGEIQVIEVLCSGRVGTGELMQGLAAGYSKVVVLSCGVGSCVHGFGCSEAKKAMERPRRLAEVAGADVSRFIFIEAERSPGTRQAACKEAGDCGEGSRVTSIKPESDLKGKAKGQK